METNRSPHAPGNTSSSHAAGVLTDLASDRQALARHLAAPKWLYLAFGVLTAVYVASPMVGPDLARRAVAGATIAAACLLVWAYQRLVGVRVSRVGTSARLTLVILLGATLLLLSASYGLRSLGLSAWVIATAAMSFALTTTLGRRFDGQYREDLRGQR